MASVDIPSAESWQISLPARRVIGLSAPGVGGTVVLRSQVAGWAGVVGSGPIIGGQKCLRIRHSTEVDVCLCAALWFPCAMHRKQEGGQSHP